MALATVILDSLYSKEDISKLISDIDRRVGIFNWDDALDVRVVKTFNINVYKKTPNGTYYFANNPTLKQTTVAIIEGYNPILGGLATQPLDSQTKEYFYSALEQIPNFIKVYRQAVYNTAQLYDDLVTAGIIVFEKNQPETGEVKNNITPNPFVELPKDEVKTADLPQWLQNPYVIIGLAVGVLVLIMILKKK